MEGVRKRILVLGGGFGGLAFVKAFDCPGVEITLIDKENHHLFQPLLYQVATAGLAAPDIAEPLRTLFSKRKEVQVLMDEVRDIDLEKSLVRTPHQSLSYDYLVIALGGRTNYFGKDDWEKHASGLKTLADAHRIRNEVLGAFEMAENLAEDNAERRRLMSAVVIGGGPTGVEMAGALAELTHRYFRRDFRRINPKQARVILVDVADRVLPMYSESLSASAKRQLEGLGVQVMTGKKVEDIQARKVVLEDFEIEAENIIWTAGVSANPVVEKLDTPKAKGGRLKVEPDCSLPGYANVFAIGDIAALEDAKGKQVPGVAPAAIQMAKHAAKLIQAEITRGRSQGEAAERESFVYRDKGQMATIGRSRAVASAMGREFSGFVAWFAWLAIHLVTLVGMRNRLSVFMKWIYKYVQNKPGARIIWRAAPGRVEVERTSDRLVL
ncbi:NAD(P)/FAD-dependent oxidoreductase [Pelagicoccus sp. SDUM812005]|uniref:NAD(P)/FAD-dependent oxidoreductase n=1 Tax=Pelagicoccus sp. SDUM812005 TaxID=3041257 RepID=UPI00280E2903|nr:NAD(P)/FAD-dependent oxidoreductase [Pelagicoccus sp. SDUM812005]MDQ8181091.1 NAD(P)/FAD-dependent oxidoreductase [Pelagicoccus sp. SDUM812005]